MIWPTIAIIFCLIVVIVLLIWKLTKKSKFENLDFKNLEIKLPFEKKKDSENPRPLEAINQSEQLITALVAMKKPFCLELAVHSIGEAIHFYISIPADSVTFTTRQIQGLFPDAQVLPITDYTIFGKNTETVGGFLRLEGSGLLPVRTYKESEVDTFAPILNSFSKISEQNEGAAFQLVVRPSSPSAKKKVQDLINLLKKGEKFDRASKLVSGGVGEFVETLKTPNKKKDSERIEPVIVDDAAIEALQKKIAKPLFDVNARILVSSDDKVRSDDLFLSIANALGQFSAPLRNGFEIIKPSRLPKLVYRYVFRVFAEDERIILNSEELASVFHLPVGQTQIPRLSWASTREAPPPANFAHDGVVIGEALYRGDSKLARVSDEDRRRHFYVVGQTGTGKSYAMLNMAVQDMEAGKGIAVIDPHGELINDILERVPASRIDDVIVFDPGDISRPLGMNMLEYDFNRPEEKTFIVNEIQLIFDRLFEKTPEGLGPMFQQYMRNSLLLLMEDMKNEPASMMEVPRIFTDDAYRERKLDRITNPSVIDFWRKEAVKTTGEQGLANMTPYITSKFGNFIANDYMRPIIGQTKSAFNFRQVMDDGKILLVNLAKGRIGDLNAGLLGMIITGRILLAALSRADISADARKDFYLYIDEFQNFTTDSISVILSEARKYRLNLVLAHQFINQLSDDIRNSVFGNVGSMAVFRVGPEDAKALAGQFEGVFSENDLSNLENRHAIARLLLDGEPSKAFNIHTLPARAGSPEVANKLKELSRLTYGRDLSEIEAEIITRLKS